MSNNNQSSDDEFRPLPITITFIVIWGALTVYLLDLSRSGYPAALWGALFTGISGFFQVIRFFDDRAKLKAFRKRQAAFRNASKDFGQSSFGSVADARDAGLGNRGGR